MKMPRRLALSILAFAVAWPAWAQAPAWPSRPLRMVVPFPPAGATDILGRTLAQKLSEALGQPVVVENKPGAGGSIGSDAVAKAPPDGYTLLMATTSTHSVGPSLNPKLPYNAERDFTPVVWVANATNILLVTPALPVKNTAELVAYAKANPGKVNYASSGNGTIVHLTAELFASTAGVSLTHVPYKGTALAVTDLMNGQVSILFDSLVSGMPHVKSGKLKALGVTGAKRSALVPDLPTIAESGVPGFVSDTWFGVFVPAGTPREIVQRLNAEINRILAMPDFREKLETLGAEPVGGTPEQFAAEVRSETAKWARVIREAGIKLE
ncbi:MAG: tripartite tricarboxylate transporter substrate binding protein [Burkholderiales bacterium]